MGARCLVPVRRAIAMTNARKTAEAMGCRPGEAVAAGSILGYRHGNRTPGAEGALDEVTALALTPALGGDGAGGNGTAGPGAVPWASHLPRPTSTRKRPPYSNCPLSPPLRCDRRTAVKEK